MSKFIGIKKLWYGAPINATSAENLTQAGVATLIAASTEIKNVHQDTWGYQQGDPNVTDYINELTGKTYYRDKVDEGEKTINFTMGEYDFSTKKALQGGTVIEESGTAVGWKAPINPELINKSIIALTKTNSYIIFTNASIVGKGDQQQKAVGLGVVATAQESEVDGISDEYWFDYTQG